MNLRAVLQLALNSVENYPNCLIAQRERKKQRKNYNKLKKINFM